MSSFHKLLSFFIGIVLMFLASQLYFALKQDVLTQEVIEQETRELSNTISEHGEITETSLTIYLKNIATTGNLYDINIVHEKLCLEPEYRFKTSDEIINEQNNGYTGSNVYTYHDVISNIPTVTDEEPNDLTMNTETNASVITSSISRPASADHVHSDTCYAGTKHVHTSSCYKTHEHNSSCYGQEYCGGTWSGNATYNITLICPSCGNDYGSHQNTTSSSASFYCSTCKKTVTSSNSVPTGNYVGSCSRCLASYNGTVSYAGQTHGYISKLICNLGSSSVLACGKDEEYYDSNGNRVTPCCNKIIVSINPTHPNQNIYSGNTLITTVTITYLDGSTAVVACNTSFNTSYIGSGQTATITYYGQNSATTHQIFTSTITVNVVATNTTCSNGHTYWLAPNGSNPGCPYCRAWLRSLSIVSPSSGSLEINQHTTLESNGVVLLAVYLDGHQEYITTGYHHNLDNVYIGSQTVTIGYKGKYVSLQVKTLRLKRHCTICNKYYELYPDGSDPGCPYCLSLIPVFTGNVMKYYTEYTTAEILNAVYNNGMYSLSKGDEIKIMVNNRTETLASNLLSFVGVKSSNKIKVWISIKIRDRK